MLNSNASQQATKSQVTSLECWKFASNHWTRGANQKAPLKDRTSKTNVSTFNAMNLKCWAINSSQSLHKETTRESIRTRTTNSCHLWRQRKTSMPALGDEGPCTQESRPTKGTSSQQSHRPIQDQCWRLIELGTIWRSFLIRSTS